MNWISGGGGGAIHWGEECLVQARTALKWMSRDQPEPFLVVGL